VIKENISCRQQGPLSGSSSSHTLCDIWASGG